MSFKTTGILALLLAVIGGYIYLFEIRGWAEKEEAEEAARKVASVQKGKVARLRLDTPGESISATKDGFRWQIVSPIDADGDYDVLEGLIQASGSLEKAGVAADSAQVALPDFSLADFGLLAPAVRLTFQEADGGEQMVAFGDRSPTGRYFYVKISGDDQVYLAESRFYFQFEMTLLDLRDKRYVAFDPDRVKGLELIVGDSRVAMERDEIHWRMTHPVQDAGDDVGVGQFLTALRDARVESFPDLAEGTETGLDSPWFSLKLYEGEDRELRGVAFGHKAGVREYRTYLARAFGKSHIFEADSAFVHQLIESGEHFRTKDVFAFNRDRVDRIEMVWPDSSLAFDRKAFEEWEVTSHPNHRVVGSRLEDFIDEIIALRAKGYVAEDMAAGRREVFESNGIRIRLMDQDALIREIVVGALGKHLFASTSDRSQIVEIDPYFMGKIRDVRIYAKTSTQG